MADMTDKTELLTDHELNVIVNALHALKRVTEVVRGGPIASLATESQRIVAVIHGLQETARRVDRALHEKRKCTGCTGGVPDYMVERSVWVQATNAGGIPRTGTTHLCFVCLERLLERRLVYTDFVDLPVNRTVKSTWLLLAGGTKRPS